MNYQELTNRIKETFSEEWLTLSQRELYEKLVYGYKTHKVLNVYGKQGVGKTFLAWNLSRKMNGIYTNNLEIDVVGKIVILDNYKNSRTDIRNLFTFIQLSRIIKIIVITNAKAQDDIVSLELKFTDQDKKIFKANLFRHLFLNFLKEGSEDNMHQLIKNNL